MKERKKLSKKTFIILWLVIVSVLLSSTIVVADYMREKYTKKVVTLQSGSGSVFSSNYLSVGTTAAPYVIPFNTIPNSDTITIDLVVCNYEYGEPTSRNCTENITYELKVWLDGVTQSTQDIDKFKISKISSLASNATESESEDLSSYTSEATCFSYTNPNPTLSNSGHSDHFYRLTFPTSQLTSSNVKIAIKAEVNERSYTNNDVKTLSAAIGIQYLDISSDRSWNGSISEYQMYSSDANLTPASFSGFNYVAEGTAAGTLRLSWNPEVFSLSQYYNENAGFISNVAKHTYPDNYEVVALRGWSYIDVEVDPTDDNKNHKTRYNFEFYKGNSGWDNLTWTQLGNDNCIKLSFSKSN